MKQVWCSAPDWAMYRARDYSGEVYWHERLPSPVESTGVPGQEKNVWRSSGRIEYSSFEIDGKACWTETLEERP